MHTFTILVLHIRFPLFVPDACTCCSGIELYGTATGKVAPAGPGALPSGPFRKFEYFSDFDTNGILHWIGTKGGSQGWTNPATSGLVSILSTPVMGNSQPISAICGRDLVRCVTQEKENAFWNLNLKDMRVRLTKYTLKHYASWDIECLRSWKLEGKNDGGQWRLIHQVDNDQTLTGKGSTATFSVDSNEYFQQISLMMTTKRCSNRVQPFKS